MDNIQNIFSTLQTYLGKHRMTMNDAASVLHQAPASWLCSWLAHVFNNESGLIYYIRRGYFLFEKTLFFIRVQ